MLDPNTFMTEEPTTLSKIHPGVGQVWTAPEDGMIVGAAGHMHEGGAGIMFQNLGPRPRRARTTATASPARGSSTARPTTHRGSGRRT